MNTLELNKIDRAKLMVSMTEALSPEETAITQKALRLAGLFESGSGWATCLAPKPSLPVCVLPTNEKLLRDWVGEQ